MFKLWGSGKGSSPCYVIHNFKVQKGGIIFTFPCHRFVWVEMPRVRRCLSSSESIIDNNFRIKTPLTRDACQQMYQFIYLPLFVPSISWKNIKDRTSLGWNIIAGVNWQQITPTDDVNKRRHEAAERAKNNNLGIKY